MSGFGLGSNQIQSYEDSPKMARQPNMKQRLEMAVADAEQRLAEAREAKAIFDQHPELERLLDIMQKGRF